MVVTYPVAGEGSPDVKNGRRNEIYQTLIYLLYLLFNLFLLCLFHSLYIFIK